MKHINKVFVFLSILLVLFVLFDINTTSLAVYNGNGAMGCYLQQSNDTSSIALPPNNRSVNVKEWNQEMESMIKTYYTGKGYTVDSNSFRCSEYRLSGLDKSSYREVMVNYTYKNKDGHTVIGHSTVFTNVKFGIDDVRIDLDEGRLVISHLLSSDIDAWNLIFEELSQIIVGISGVGVLCCMLAFVLQFIKLGMVADNPSERQRVVQGILWTGIGTAGCSSAALIFGIMYNIL